MSKMVPTYQTIIPISSTNEPSDETRKLLKYSLCLNVFLFGVVIILGILWAFHKG